MKRILSLILSLATVLSIASASLVSAYAANTLYWPVPAVPVRQVTQGYHDGGAIDIGAAGGSTVVAAMGGTVTNIWLCPTQHYGSYGDCNGFGTGLVILGDDGRYYQYAHMQANSIPSNVYRTARVSAGQQIGKVGTTGNSSGNHLHFGISTGTWYNKSGINPMNEIYGTAPAPVSISIGAANVSSITNTNAYVKTSVTKTAGTWVSTCGVYLGTSASNMTKRSTENLGSATNNYRSGTGFDIWYDLTGELGIKLTPGTTYYVKFYCVVNGKEYTGTTVSFRTTGTAPSTNVTLAAVNPTLSNASNGVKLSWSKVSNATGYYIYRKSGSGSYTKIATTTGSSYTDTKASNGTKYTYTVRAYKGSTLSAIKAKSIVRVSPTAISSLTNTATKKMVVKWSKVSGATGYQIRYTLNGTTKTVTVSGASTVSKTISSLSKGKTYSVQIRAYKTVSGTNYYSAWSSAKSVKISK